MSRNVYHVTYRCDDCEKTRTVAYLPGREPVTVQSRKWRAIRVDHARASPACAAQSHSGIRVQAAS